MTRARPVEMRTVEHRSFTATPRLVLRGGARAGEPLSVVTRGAWAPVAPEVVQYDWFADGTYVTWTSEPTFVPTDDLAGRAVSVMAWSRAAGFRWAHTERSAAVLVGGRAARVA